MFKFLTKNKMSDNLMKISDFFIQKAVDNGSPMGHLKLQKMLYIAFGWYLVRNNKNLFNDWFIAKKHGMVIGSVYDTYKKYGPDPILKYKSHNLDKEIYDFLNLIWDQYGQYSSMELCNYSHIEGNPFSIISKYDNLDKERIVERSLIYNFFLSEQKRLDKESNLINLVEHRMDSSIFIMESEGRSYARLDIFSDTSKITDLSTNLDSRKRGFASQIISRCEEISRESKVSSICLWVDKDSWMYNWYSKLGYVEYADNEEEKGAVWMRKDL